MIKKGVHNDREEKDTARCPECQQELRLGDECLHVQLGVIGNRGFVPLGKATNLCGHVCARRYFGSDEEVTRLPRRVP